MYIFVVNFEYQIAPMYYVDDQFYMITEYPLQEHWLIEYLNENFEFENYIRILEDGDIYTLSVKPQALVARKYPLLTFCLHLYFSIKFVY